MKILYLDTQLKSNAPEMLQLEKEGHEVISALRLGLAVKYLLQEEFDFVVIGPHFALQDWLEVALVVREEAPVTPLMGILPPGIELSHELAVSTEHLFQPGNRIEFAKWSETWTRSKALFAV